jgi:hypothetical protein
VVFPLSCGFPVVTVTAMLRDWQNASTSASRWRVDSTITTSDIEARVSELTVGGLSGPGPGLPAAIWTMRELEALADAAGPYAELVQTLGYRGLRWGERSALASPEAPHDAADGRALRPPPVPASR